MLQNLHQQNSRKLMPSLITDIIGQVQRLDIKPSEKTAMLPMYEAISNALHAIVDRFGDDEIDKGEIRVTIERDVDESVVSVIVADNGVGLNYENYLSFCTPHSTHKLKRGGKGLGRLSWLKVNRSVRLESRYAPVGDGGKRVFNFALLPEEQIKELDEEPIGVTSATGTCVYLNGFVGDFGKHFPKKENAVVLGVIRHFLPLFAGDKSPKIHLVDRLECDLQEHFKSLITESREEMIEIDIAYKKRQGATQETIIVRHMRCDKSVATTAVRGKNSLCYCAHGRGVEEVGIDKQIGQSLLLNDTVYVGALTGDFLDTHVNAERTSFTYNELEKSAIRTALTKSIALFLEEDFKKLYEQKSTILGNLIKKRPSLKNVIKNSLDDAVRDNISLSSTSEEEMFRDIVLQGYRIENRRKSALNSLLEGKSVSDESRELAIDLVQDHTEAQKNALAEYILNRKIIIELLERSLGGAGVMGDKHFREEIVHKLICPMGATKDGISYSDHNLWLVDDRLSYSSFFTSDKQIRAFTNNPSQKEPDLSIFYDNPQAWQLGRGNNNTLIIVEFKRPGRDDYDGNSSPVRQISKYIEDLKGGKRHDCDGVVIDQIDDKTNFFAYIIADLSSSLKAELRGFVDTFDGKGLFLHSANNPRAYIEVIPYKKILEDAKCRNQVFFDTLNGGGD